MIVYADQMPGVSAAQNTTETEYLYGPDGFGRTMGVTLVSTARDSGNTAFTTVLRRGLTVGKITATGKYAQYDATASDGTQFPVGFLDNNVSLLSQGGAVVDKQGQVRYFGFVRVADLIGFDENARVQLGNRFIYDDYRFPHLNMPKVVAKTADYTVLSTDNATLFTTLGAAGAVNFTLPAVARGYRFKFFNAVDQNMTVTAPSGKLITFNNAAATSVAFSTSGNKIGAGVEIVAAPDASKYLALPTGANTMTVA